MLYPDFTYLCSRHIVVVVISCHRLIAVGARGGCKDVKEYEYIIYIHFHCCLAGFGRSPLWGGTIRTWRYRFCAINRVPIPDVHCHLQKPWFYLVWCICQLAYCIVASAQAERSYKKCIIALICLVIPANYVIVCAYLSRVQYRLPWLNYKIVPSHNCGQVCLVLGKVIEQLCSLVLTNVSDKTLLDLMHRNYSLMSPCSLVGSVLA